jgi:hypothetical protein
MSYGIKVFLFNETTGNAILAPIVKVKLSLQQAVKAHRVVRRRGSHILSRKPAYRWR